MNSNFGTRAPEISGTYAACTMVMLMACMLWLCIGFAWFSHILFGGGIDEPEKTIIELKEKCSTPEGMRDEEAAVNRARFDAGQGMHELRRSQAVAARKLGGKRYA